MSLLESLLREHASSQLLSTLRTAIVRFQQQNPSTQWLNNCKEALEVINKVSFSVA
jgi:hypothetical protein